MKSKMMMNEIFLDIITVDWTMGDAYDFDILVPEGSTWVVEWGDGHVDRCQGNGKRQGIIHNYPFKEYGYHIHVYTEYGADILGFNASGYEVRVMRVDTSHCHALLYLRSVCTEQIDVSANPLLKELICDDCDFEILDLSHNSALEVLWCRSCRHLTKLNLSHNVALRELNIAFSGVKKLGLNNRSTLQWVDYQNSDLDTKSEEYLLRIIARNGGTVVKPYDSEEEG